MVAATYVEAANQQASYYQHWRRIIQSWTTRFGGSRDVVIVDVTVDNGVIIYLDAS